MDFLGGGRSAMRRWMLAGKGSLPLFLGREQTGFGLGSSVAGGARRGKEKYGQVELAFSGRGAR